MKYVLNCWFWMWLILFVAIHTIDMELTTNYIGDDWSRETFLPMHLAIKEIGVYNACWISRIIVYTFILLALVNHKSKVWRSLLITVTILYYAAMLQWLVTLEYIEPYGKAPVSSPSFRFRHD